MIIALLVSLGAFFIFLFLLSIEDYRRHKIQQKLNRQLLKDQSSKKYSMFSILGDKYNKLDESLKEINLKIDTDSFILYVLYALVAIFIYTLYSGNIIVGAMITIGFFAILKVLHQKKRLNLNHKMEKQFGEFAEDIAVTLKTNPDLFSAIKTTLEHTRQPLYGLMGKVVMDVEYGKSIDEALINLKKYTSSELIANWVDSITFARTAKSDLASVCDYTADRTNNKLVRSTKIEAILSKTKGTIFMVLAIVMGSSIMTIRSSPDFQFAYSTTVGQIILVIVFSVMLLTTYFIFKSIDNMIKS